MSWIKTIVYENATGHLLKLYDRIKGSDNNVDNILVAHSLRPHTLEGHMALYKKVLHHPRNTVPKWFLETIGIYTSIINECEYCVVHHYEGMSRLLKDEDRSKTILAALQSDGFAEVFDGKESAALSYSRKLTQSPSAVSEEDISMLRQSGWEDGEILEINQIVAYFNYANRTVLGLGINHDSDILGLSPSSTDTDDWHHQ